MAAETQPKNQTPEGPPPAGQTSGMAVPPPPRTTSTPENTVETISLFDLMQESAHVPPSPQGTAVPPAPLISDDTATLNAPTTPTTRRPIGLPLSAEELTPPESRPLESDPDATAVQPRVAFPGSTKQRARPNLSDAPTAIYPPTPERPGSNRPPSQPPARQTTPDQPTTRQTPPRQPQRAATSSPTAPAPAPVRVAAAPPTPTSTPPRPQTRRHRQWRSCLSRALVILLLLGVIGFAVGIAGAAVGYSLIAQDLPSPQELRQRASTFETARIFDRNGNLLYALADPNAGNRTYVPLDRISPYLINATIATEDSGFYDNLGFDPIGIARAVLQAAREGEFVSGASTITQQLVRALLLSEEERTERSFSRKVREIILAAEISRTYEKNEILELYLNEIYYGNLAYGIEAAAQTYFKKNAADLTLTEASLLAGLPQAPALWDPYTAPDKAIGRQWEVLTLMVKDGYATLDQAQTALNETNLFVYNMQPPEVTIRFPHFTFTVLQQAEDILGAQSIYRGGLNIYTTIDPAAQVLAETAVTSARDQIIAAGANNAAMVVLQPETGEILALVGSADFNDEVISGQVNMALQPRQAGSSIKPMIYLSALEKGWTPATLIWDVPTQFPNGANPPYEPKNFDDEFHGPLLLRPSLGNSYNIPAVKALEYVGVCNFIANAQKFGLTALQDDGCQEVGQPRNYGLALALGAGEIPPLQMAGAFAILANQGRYQPPYAISRIENNQGEVLFAHTAVAPAAAQVIRPEHAYLLSHILSDNNARQPEFGTNNYLVIPGQTVAVKTGTSGSSRFDVRDGWTIGYTPQVVTAVWIGNTNNNPIGEGQSGYRIASPIWNQFMTQYLTGRPALDFVRPPGIIEVEICTDSGVAGNADTCPNRRQELFAGDQPPLSADNHFLQNLPIDLWTGFRANDACRESVYAATFVNLLASGDNSLRSREIANAQTWLQNTAGGQSWAAAHNISLPLRLPPNQLCTADTPRPQVLITQPAPNSDIIGQVTIAGTVKGPNYDGYQVEFGLSHDPGGWGIIQPWRPDAVENGPLATWNTDDLDNGGPITLRVVIYGPDNPYTEADDPVTLEQRVLLTLLLPTATPTPTPSQTPTATATPSPTATPLISPTPTITNISTNTPTPSPTASPTASPMVSPTAVPSVTLAPNTPTETPTPTATLPGYP